MDYWKYSSEGKGLWSSEELDFPLDDHGSCKNKVIGCEMKPFFNVENYPLVSNTQALERLDLLDLGFSDEIRNSYSISSEPSGEVFSDEIGTDSYGNVVSPLCEEKESGSRVSTGFMQSNNQDFSMFDLKLGRLADGGGGKNNEFPKASVPTPSTVSPFPVKRSRSTVLYPRPPCCQVFGCNKDLSSCKGYYKRHKVCDVHTKTSKVIVDGIEQRFCQQCSRFHLLAEFDDGKRSCRRRLAAHNKRRRKPQLTSESGTRIIGFSPSFGFPEILRSAVVNSGDKMGDVMSTVKDNIAGFQRFSGIQQTSCALSLLSAQSHNMPSQSQEATSIGSLINQASQAFSSRFSPGISKVPLQSGFHAPEIYSAGDDDHVDPTTTNCYDGDSIFDFKLSDAGSARGQDSRNNTTTDCHNPLGRGIILDLLQLSSHLQRIEQQRHSTESQAG